MDKCQLPQCLPLRWEAGSLAGNKWVTYQCRQENLLSRLTDTQGPYFLQTRQWGSFLLPFNVNQIHKHVKNPHVTQENTEIYI